MFWIKVLVSFFIFSLIQTKIPMQIGFFPLSIDLVFLSVLFLALCYGEKRGFFIGLVGGLLIDIISIAPLGFHTLGYALCGYLAGKWQGKYYTQSIWIHFFVVILMTSLFFVLSLMIKAFYGEVLLGTEFVSFFIPLILMNLFLTPVMRFYLRCLRLTYNPYSRIQTHYERYVTH